MDERIRIGVTSLEIDAYGGTFSAATDLGDFSEEGVTVTFTSAQKKVASGNRLTLKEIFEIGPQELAIEANLQESKVDHLALSFGQPTSEVTDNTGDTPKNESIIIGGYNDPNDYVALRLKAAQIVASTLYDILLCYRVKIIPKYTQAFTVKNERIIPVRFECTEDPNNSYAYAEFQQEYTT